MAEPLVANGGFLQDLPECPDLVVKRAARRRLASRGRADAMHPVVLNGSGVDLGKSHLAEERNQVKPQADAVPFNPLGAALTFGDNGVFLLELLSSLGKGRLCF
nr:hypothetical protein [Rhizobium sp. NFACC06-2]